jgi:hypothetical protein
MSQVKFKAKYKGEDVEVVTGWDPPLGYYHLTIFDADNKAVFDGFDILGFCRKLNMIKEVMNTLGIQVPPETLDIVDRREGNVVYNWNGELSIWTKKTL